MNQSRGLVFDIPLGWKLECCGIERNATHGGERLFRTYHDPSGVGYILVCLGCKFISFALHGGSGSC